MMYQHEVPDWTTLEPAASEIAGSVSAAAQAVASQLRSGALPPISIANQDADLAPAEARAVQIRAQAEHVLVLGIGGSSLGAQALAQISGYYTAGFSVETPSPHMHFLESPDGLSLTKLLDQLPLARTHLLIVSKSGGTAESLIQALAVIARMKSEGLSEHLPDLGTVVTEPRDNALGALAREYGFARLDHPTDIGGRYSVFSIVGLLPAMIMGLDVRNVRSGANSVAEAFLAGPADHAASQGARFAEAASKTGRRIQILMPYTDRLERFAMWYRQIWAESIGKDGKGSLPVRAMGPVDQHSQLQLYLDGPDDYAVTVLTEDLAGAGPQVPADATGVEALAYLKGHAIGDLVMAEAIATLRTFQGRSRPARLIQVKTVDETSVGALMAHYMLETVITAELTNVNAFDQPAVEEGKVLARKYLAEGIN